MNDVIITLTATGELSTNIAHAIVLHSPTGFAVGYRGSGPTEFALNILHTFLPVAAVGDAPTFDQRPLTADVLPGDAQDDARIVCRKGVVSRRAFDLRCDFRDRFLAGLDLKNGETVTIAAADIAAWIDGQGGRHA